MEFISQLLQSDALYYKESEISVFTMIDIENYNIILKRILHNPELYDNIEYEKCLCYGNKPGVSVRVKTSSNEPICPVAFAELKKYNYNFDVKRIHSPRKRYAIPVWCDNYINFTNASTRVAMEYDLDQTLFIEYANTAPNDITGFGRKELITDRIIIGKFTNNGITKRLSINKKCKFSGNGIHRQPDVPVYIIELELEYIDSDCLKNKLNINAACHEYVQLLRDKLLLNNVEMYNISRSGSVNCLPENDLFLSIFNTFKRNFVCGKPPINISQNERAYICPKWDGVRAIGFWRKDALILYSCQFGFKYFPNLPTLFSPDVICQVEYFEDTNSFIVNELYACVNIEMETDFVYFNRKHGNSCRFGEGLYNGSNTSVQIQDNRRYVIVDVHAIDSISAIDFLHSKYKSMFTFHRRIIEWPVNPEYIIRKFGALVTGATDGVLLKIVSVYKSPLYFKLKTLQTIELTYSPSSGHFTSSNNTIYDTIILDTNDFDFKYYKNLCDVSNTTRTMEFSIIPSEYKLKFKCIRYDKIEPDSDEKIKKLFDI